MSFNKPTLPKSYDNGSFKTILLYVNIMFAKCDKEQTNDKNLKCLRLLFKNPISKKAFSKPKLKLLDFY